MENELIKKEANNSVSRNKLDILCTSTNCELNISKRPRHQAALFAMIWFISLLSTFGGMNAQTTLDLSNQTFDNVHSTGDGGAIWLNQDIVTITACIYTDNTADNNGGAIWMDTNCDVTITDCTFTGNNAGNVGGAIYVNDYCAVVIDNCIFSGNGSASGGGIYIATDGELTIKNGSLVDDDIFNYGDLIIESGVIISGAIYNYGTLTINGAIIKYSVTNGNGTLGATLNGIPIPSGYCVPTGSNVVFAASPDPGNRVKEWMLDGTPVPGVTTNTYTLSAIATSHTVTVEFEVNPTPPTPTYPPRITGSTSMKLTEGYAATSSGVFTVTGTTPVTVSKTSGDDHITWNRTTRQLDIAEGLAMGVYEVVLTASNRIGTFNFTFTLTVEERVYYLDIPMNVEGGTVEVQTNTPYVASEGETVTIIVTPDEGYELESIAVYDYYNRDVTVTLNCTGNACTFTMPAHHISIVVVFRPVTTGIDNEQWIIDNGQLKAYVQNGVLHVSGLTQGVSWNVYNIFGTPVYQGEASSDKAEVVLPGRGIYIVISGNSAVKINN